ncbi:MAG: UDP-N-acetylglucosamine 2-epimerase [Planctomycetota bacterium]|jgi:UDP-hydrolysing UDP-N-acetyl-D-glucosamine 2-epimerase
MRRRIAVVTGTRAEYGLLRTCMRAIEAHPRLELQTLVTGMHLLRKFGTTVRDIEADGFAIDARVRMQKGDDSPDDQALGLARGVRGIARALEELGSDVVLVLGDRIEALAGASAALTTGRVLAHVHGGDMAQGDFDDRIRHAITQMAQVHFAASSRAAQRIRRMRVTPSRISVVGAPGLDEIVAMARKAKSQGRRSGKAVVVYHAFGRRPAAERRVMARMLRAVERAGLSPILVYPNSDRGHGGVIGAIENYRTRHPAVDVFRSLPRELYLKLLITADLMIGNSSSGVIEAPAAGTPSVNVGQRQRGRQPGGSSVIECDESAASIASAIARALRKRPIIGRPDVYGNGSAGRKIATGLAGIDLGKR